MKKISLFIALLLGSGFLFSQTEISGVTPSKTISVGGETLNFNGAGLREKFFLDLYVGTLYLTNTTKDANKIIDANESMAITLDIVSGLITSEKMIDAINEGFEKSMDGNTASLATEIQEFKNAFKEEIVEGDHFVIAYTKGDETVEIHKNGKKVKRIKGKVFKKALFGIWLGNEPADSDLKDGMLGN